MLIHNFNIALPCTQIQRMVISGGHFKPDALKPKEVVSLLLDDEELESKCEELMVLLTNPEGGGCYIGENVGD